MSFDLFLFLRREITELKISLKNRMAVLREKTVTQSFILKVTIFSALRLPIYC